MMTESLIVNNVHDIYMQYRILNKHILGYKNLPYLVGLAEPLDIGMSKVSQRKR
jgi:hypothetical protein